MEQKRLAPTLVEQVASSATFLQRYDIHVCLYGMNGEVYSEWEGLTNFFLKMQEFDDTIQMLPWSVKDHNKQNLPLAISRITYYFFDLHTYVPHLASQEAHWMTQMELGHMRHPYLFLSSSISPEELVNKMGPWLRATKQGLWPHQLRLTEQTKCISWLLYLAPEYHLSALRQQIQQETRIEVALCFRTIHEGRPTNAEHTPSRTKAIHMEVDLNILPEQQNRLERIYSSSARTFPLGIKM